MKKLFTTIVLLLFVGTIFSQAPTWVMNWGTTTASPNADGWDIEPDNFGNVYMSYRTKDIQDMDFGPGVYNAGVNGSVSTFIARYTTNGVFKWGFSLPNSSTYWHKIEPDNHGNFYLSGTFQGTVDFDPGPLTNTLTAAIGTNVFIAKYDSSMNLKWAKKLNVTTVGGFQSFNCMKIDNFDKLYLAVSYKGANDLDPGIGNVLATSTGTAATDQAIIKLDSAGSYLWHKSITGQGYEVINDISIDYTNNRVNLVGAFQGTATVFTGTFVSSGSYDAFVSSLTAASGGTVFTKKFGGTSTDQAKSIESISGGQMIVHGEYDGTVDFDPGVGVVNFTSSSAPSDLFLSKFDSNGLLVWAKNMSGLGIERNMDMDVDSKKYIWLADYTSNCLDADPGTPVVSKCAAVSGAGAMVMIKLDSLGNYVTSFSITTPTVGTTIGAESVNCSLVDNYIYIAGGFNGLTDFDPGTGNYNVNSIFTGLNNHDAVFMKYPSCPTSPTVSVASTTTLICVGQTATLTASGGNSYNWFGNGTTSSIVVSPSVTTTYSVSGVDNFGCFATSVFTQSVSLCTSLEESYTTESLQIFPNPSTGIFTVNTNYEVKTLEVFNLIGEQVLSLTPKTSKVLIDLSNQSNGVYFIRINNIVKRVIKN